MWRYVILGKGFLEREAHWLSMPAIHRAQCRASASQLSFESAGFTAQLVKGAALQQGSRKQMRSVRSAVRENIFLAVQVQGKGVQQGAQQAQQGASASADLGAEVKALALEVEHWKKVGKKCSPFWCGRVEGRICRAVGRAVGGLLPGSRACSVPRYLQE